MDIRQDFHIIKTDNSFYRNLGLDILTTGSLADWWDETQNRVIIENPQDDDAPRVLGERFLDDNISWMEFVPDKEHPTIGTYDEKTLEDVLVTYSDILLACYDLVDPKIKKLENLASLIKLNEIVSTVNKEKGKIFTENLPSEEIGKYPPEWQGVLTDGNFELMKNGNELLQKIKKSKSGYIDFTGEPEFIIHPYGFKIKESVKFKLLLLDDNNSEISRPGVAIQEFRFSGPATINADGDRSIQQVAAPLGFEFDQSTGTWKSGNKTIWAMLETDIGPAQTSLTADTLKELLTDEALKNPSLGNMIAPGTGRAIPLFQQDKSALQWSANFVLTGDKRCSASPEEANAKVIYDVYNYTDLSFNKNDMVLLTDAQGKWSIIPTKINVEDESTAASSNKWGPFTYFWTNADFFFVPTTADFQNLRFNPRFAELAAHYEYYRSFGEGSQERNLNFGTNYGPSGGYNKSSPFNTSGPQYNLVLKNGYFQTTSFDYLDGQILGTNDYCRISTTNPNKRPNGETIPYDPSNYTSRNAAICGVFHGCIFPDGYTGFGEFLETRNYTARVNNDASIEANFFMPGIIQGTGLPFNSDKGRNKCSNATFANIGDDLNLDNVKWERAKGEPDVPIFSSDTLDSVPADVMLNASLTGVNGSPIVPITSYRFHEASSLSDNISILNDTNIFDPILNNYWAQRSTPRDDGRSDAFDFTPNNPNHIMFRPLKLEAYVQLDGINSDIAKDLTRDGSHNNRWVFSAEAWRTQMDFQRPISQTAVARNLAVNDESFWRNGPGPSRAPRWGGDLLTTGEFSSLRSVYKPFYNYLHNYSYWLSEDLFGADGAMKWAKDPLFVQPVGSFEARQLWKGAGAYGVITTSRTIGANESIVFTTDNRYGMGAAGWGRFTIAGGLENQDRTWGNDLTDNSYRRHNITDLSVRIYHHHPVEQTIYDPRTFAVHHLNPHLALNGHYNNNGERPPATATITHEGSEYNITYEEPLTDVDYRVPTDYKHQGNQITAVELNVATTVFSDVSEQNGDNYPLPEEYWALKTDRVGKLLPYRWSRKVIKFLNFCTTDDSGRGTGYVKGDIIGNTQYGIRLEVDQVGPNENVTSVNVLNRGSALPRSGLCRRDGTLGTIRLSGIQTANGEGFDAGVIGIIVEEMVTDPKPLLVLNNGQDITRISSDKLKPTHATTGQNSVVEPLAIVDETKTTTINIDDKSPNGLYDLFFHFHNDISHTWLASNEEFHGSLNNSTECVEQYVDLRISTL